MAQSKKKRMSRRYYVLREDIRWNKAMSKSWSKKEKEAKWWKKHYAENAKKAEQALASEEKK
jgi:hypothetical protein